MLEKLIILFKLNIKFRTCLFAHIVIGAIFEHLPIPYTARKNMIR